MAFYQRLSIFLYKYIVKIAWEEGITVVYKILWFWHFFITDEDVIFVLLLKNNPFCNFSIESFFFLCTAILRYRDHN